jgi:hypothetical protein
MTYTAAEGRQQILDALALAADDVALALADLSEAYEQLDEHTGERLEEALFRPLQAAYGRIKSEHNAFAERTGLPGRDFAVSSQVAPSTPAKALIEKAADLSANAGEALGDLQDSMLPVEVGDAQLRAGLAEVRRLLAGLPPAARELVRTFGR